MALDTDSDVYYPERYYYSLSNLDASALGLFKINHDHS